MLLEGKVDEAKSCQVLIPVMVVNNDSIDVNKGSFDVTKDHGWTEACTPMIPEGVPFH